MDKAIKERKEEMSLVKRVKTLSFFKLPAKVIARIINIDIKTVNYILNKC